MILEGLVTSLASDGRPHLAPMGPVVDEAVTRLTLRPFATSQTCANLLARGAGVLHATDDVELLARAAIGALAELPPLRPAAAIEGWILADACRWWEFRVTEIDDAQPRVRLECRIVARGRGREFFGLNRAKHAVVEAAILATRVAILPRDELLGPLAHLASLVEKTGGPAEARAFALLDGYIRSSLGASPPAP